MSSQPFRAAFIGGALNSAVGYTHFNASRLDGHFRVDAGCFSRNLNQNRKSAEVYGVTPARTYSLWQELLAQEQNKIDVVIVLTPTPSHAEIVVAAIDHGFPVICEKALGMSSDECRYINEAEKSRNGYVAVTFNYSGYPMVRELREMIREGRLGEVQQIHIEMPQEGFLRVGANPQDWRRIDHSVPTVSLDLGVHVFHLIDFLTEGRRPRRVVGDQARFGQFPGLIDNVYCLAQYEKQLRVVAWWGKTALGLRNGLRIRVFGTKGGAEWYQMEPENLKWADDDGHFFMIDRGSGEAQLAKQQRYNRFKAGHPSGFIEAFANLYADVAHDLGVLRAGGNQRSEYVFGTEHSVRALHFLETVSRSAAGGTWMDL